MDSWRGKVIGRKYKIERVLRRARVSVVAVARHRHLGVPIAIKLLHGESAEDPECVARFLREGQLACQLRSEHVVRILDVGVVDEYPYIAMELLEGEDVSHAIEQSGAIAEKKAVSWLLEACEAIAEAHAIGIVHRDIKPSNLFVTRGSDGSPFIKVLDFGIATESAVPEDMRMTATKDIMGTPLYMSPEVMESARNADARSDVWALGATLYEMLTTRVPFEGSNMVEVYANIARGKPRPPREWNAEISEACETVVLRCLERDPAVRYGSVLDLVEALAAASFPSEEAAACTARVVRVSKQAAARLLRTEGDLAGAPSDTYGPTVRRVERLARLARKRVGWIGTAAAAGIVAAIVLFVALRAPSSTQAPAASQPAVLAASPPASCSTATAEVGADPPTPSARTAETAIVDASPLASSSAKPRVKPLGLPIPRKAPESDFATDPHR